MTTLIKGTNLTDTQRKEVLRAYVNRHHAIPTVYKDDNDWVNRHAFYIRKDGHLSNMPTHCEPDFMADN